METESTTSKAAARVQDAATQAKERVQDAASQAKERGQELLHTASDRANHLYHQASDYAGDAAYEARERARVATRYARRASDAGVSFVSTHALPLTVIGLGIGWLALSIRNDTRLRELELDVHRVPTLRRELREPIASYAQPRVSDGTTESPKLLGVRTIDVSPRSDFGPTS